MKLVYELGKMNWLAVNHLSWSDFDFDFNFNFGGGQAYDRSAD
jgi:hypothetical protein